MYSQWKQRLYAFLLRRVLGPYLSAPSLQQLHESIEVSFQEGKFLLKEVDLNVSYLTRILSKRGESYVSVVTVRRARIRKLQINLTLEETHRSDDPDKTARKAKSSVAWRAMKLGQGTDSEGGSVMLLAHVEIEGFDIELEPGHEFTPSPSSPKPEPSSATEMSSTVGMIAAYVEAAMSSLRLSLQMKHLRVKLCSPDSSASQFIEFHLAGAQYRDVDDISISQLQQSRYRTALHKAVDFSGITFRTGQLPALKEGVSPDADEAKRPSTASVIAKSEGSGQVSFRIIEYDRTLSSSSETGRIATSSEDEAPRIQQDLEVSLNQRLNFSVDRESIQSLLDITSSFLMKHEEDLEGSVLQPLAAIGAKPSDGQADELVQLESEIEVDKEDWDAMAGIMKQYAEARKLAERNELRGGILLPSTAYEEGVAYDGSVSFDAFFDANDHSFSLYQSRLEQSISASTAIDDEQTDFVHTKIRFHLQQCGVKIGFPRSEVKPSVEDFEKKNWHGLPDEYILVTLGDISVTSSISHQVSDISLNAVHLEVEDAVRDTPMSLSGRDHFPSIEIGNVLRFDKSDDSRMDEGDLLVTEAPCISLQVHSHRVLTSVSTADLILEPLELIFSSGTLSNILYLISQLEFCCSPGASLSRMANEEDVDKKMPWRLSASCPSVSIMLPLGLNLLEGAQGAEQYTRVFERCGYMLPHAPISRRSCLGFTLDGLSVLQEATTSVMPEEESYKTGSGTETSVTCQRLLCFLTSLRSCGHGLDNCMHRADIVASSGHTPLSFTYRKNVTPTEDSINNVSFPVVPPLSTFKARQEDEDSDNEDAFYREFSCISEEANTSTTRASDPQDTMLQEASQCSSAIDIYFPELVGDLTREEAVSLSNVLLIELSIIGSGIEQKDQNEISFDESPELVETSHSKTSSVTICIDQVTLAVHQELDEDDGMLRWYSHEMMVEGFKAHAVLLPRSRLKTLRVLAHELNFFEVRDLVQHRSFDTPQTVPSFRGRCDDVRRRTFQNGSSVATPIFYRSQLFAPLSPESPAVLFDILKPDDDVHSSEWNVHCTLYNMTHRYDVESRWLQRLQALVIPSHRDENSRENRFAVTDTSLFKIFVSIADCNVDYMTPKAFSTRSRTLVRLGDFRLSSNLVLPLGRSQACRVSLGDLTVLLCNTRYDHTFENARLARASTVLAKDELMTTKREKAPDEVLRDMNLISMITLDALDIVMALLAHEGKGDETSADPIVTVGVSLGMLSLYGCKDSFTCFADTIGELQLYLISLDAAAVEALKAQTLIMPTDTCNDASNFVESTTITSINPARASETGDSVDFLHSNAISAGDEYSVGGDDWATIENEWSKSASIAPDEEQAARWYSAGDTNDESDSLPISDIRNTAVHLDRNANESAAKPKLWIIHNHFPLKPVSDPFSSSDSNIAKYAGTAKTPTAQARILIRDGKVRCRFFDGYDWPKLKSGRHKEEADFIIEATSQDKIKAKKEDLDEQIADRMTDSQANKLQTKATLLGDLLNENTESGSGTFDNTPLPEERGAMLDDLAEQRRLSRRINKFLQVSLSGLKMRVETFPETTEHRLASCVEVSMADFFVAETISGMKPIKVLGEWFNETEHPRDSSDGLIMLKMVTWHPKYRITDDNEVANDESQLTLEMLPLRCHIDQRAIRFGIAFFTTEEGDTEKSTHAWAAGLKEIPPPLFQSFKVEPCKLKVNYTPVKVNVEALREGSYVELINISPLIDMVITLQEVHIQGLVGFGPNVKELLSRWIEDVCATQMYKFLANARPFQPISSVGGSAANLVVIPWEAYKKGEKVGRAMRSGAASFAGSVAYETLNTSAKLTGLAARALSSATPDLPSMDSSVSSSFLPSRPNDTPRGISDTANHALESLARGFETANYKVVIVPYREYRRSGTTGAVKSVMRGIPVAIAAPVGAASEALSYTLLGARNQVRPDKRKEEEASERGLRHDL